MQKVEGSSPFIRFKKGPHMRAFPFPVLLIPCRMSVLCPVGKGIVRSVFAC